MSTLNTSTLPGGVAAFYFISTKQVDWPHTIGYKAGSVSD